MDDTKKEFEIDEFNPKKEELVTLAEKYKGLTIKNMNDIEGYSAVNKARKELKTVRCDYDKQVEGAIKSKRDDYNSFRTNLLKLKDSFVKIIEPLEIELKGKTDAIDDERARKQRVATLPERKERLETIEGVWSDEDILSMDDKEFDTNFNEAKTLWLEEKERMMKEKEDKIKADEERIENEKKIEAEKKKAREEALEEAEKQAKLDKEESERKIIEEAAKVEHEKKESEARAVVEKQEAIATERKKAEVEKQAIIDEQARKDKEAKEEIERKEKVEAEAKAEAELKQKRIDNDKSYHEFLDRNKYVEGPGFLLTNTDTKVVIYKKIDEFIKP